MKSTTPFTTTIKIISAASLFLFAALASAAPVAQGTVDIKIEFDVGALSTAVFPVPFGRLFQPSIGEGFIITINGASGVPIPTDSIVCQAFQFPDGIAPLGIAFNISSPGGRIAASNTAGRISSIFCSDAAGVQAELDEFPPAFEPLPASTPAPPPVATGGVQVPINGSAPAPAPAPTGGVQAPINSSIPALALPPFPTTGVQTSINGSAPAPTLPPFPITGVQAPTNGSAPAPTTGIKPQINGSALPSAPTNIYSLYPTNLRDHNRRPARQYYYF